MTMERAVRVWALPQRAELPVLHPPQKGLHLKRFCCISVCVEDEVSERRKEIKDKIYL